MTWHDTAFVFASFNTLLCLTWTRFIVYMEQKKILIRHASWHAATVLTKISFVYRAKIACPCHHHYAGNPVEGHKCERHKAGSFLLSTAMRYSRGVCMTAESIRRISLPWYAWVGEWRYLWLSWQYGLFVQKLWRGWRHWMWRAAI